MMNQRSAASSLFRRRARGFSFMEMMVTVTIFTLVGAFVAATFLVVAKNSRRTIASMPAENEAYVVADKMRQELLSAEFGSVNIAVDNLSIQFRNPALPGPSTIAIDANTGDVVYTPDVSVPDDFVVFGNVRPANSSISTDTSGGTIQLVISTAGQDRNNDLRIITHRDEIKIRN